MKNYTKEPYKSSPVFAETVYQILLREKVI